MIMDDYIIITGGNYIYIWDWNQNEPKVKCGMLPSRIIIGISIQDRFLVLGCTDYTYSIIRLKALI